MTKKTPYAIAIPRKTATDDVSSVRAVMTVSCSSVTAFSVDMTQITDVEVL